MLNLKELKNRELVDKQTVKFQYDLPVDAGGPEITAQFERNKENPLVWRMRIIFGRTRDTDSQVYNFEYQLPKAGMELVMIAVIGLKYFQLHIKEEIQMKSIIDINLGEVLGGMIG